MRRRIGRVFGHCRSVQVRVAHLDCAMEVRAMVNTFPFGQDFVLLRDAMRQMLQESFVPSGGSRYGWSTGSQTMARPLPMDVYATPDEAGGISPGPGMSPEKLDVTHP